MMRPAREWPLPPDDGMPVWPMPPAKPPRRQALVEILPPGDDGRVQLRLALPPLDTELQAIWDAVAGLFPQDGAR